MRWGIAAVGLMLSGMATASRAYWRAGERWLDGHGPDDPVFARLMVAGTMLLLAGAAAMLAFGRQWARRLRRPWLGWSAALWAAALVALATHWLAAVWAGSVRAGKHLDSASAWASGLPMAVAAAFLPASFALASRGTRLSRLSWAAAGLTVALQLVDVWRPLAAAPVLLCVLWLAVVGVLELRRTEASP